MSEVMELSEIIVEAKPPKPKHKPSKPKEIICPYCGYRWKPRIKSPKKCARCTHWLKPWR